MHGRVISVGQASVDGAGNDRLQALEQAGVQIHLFCLTAEESHVLQQVLHHTTIALGFSAQESTCSRQPTYRRRVMHVASWAGVTLECLQHAYKLLMS